jgi:uncharacterized damage-inducible protein DinB
MNKQAVLQTWDHIRQVNGIGFRLIEALPENKLDATVIPGMRTPKELVVHMYGQVLREVAEGTVSGTITNNAEKNEKQIVGGLKTKNDLLRYCHECWDAADKAVRSLPDDRIMGMTATPWGMSFPGFVAFSLMSDEYIHHRGQLYAYLRTLGVTPPHMWSFQENAEAFRPLAAATA